MMSRDGEDDLLGEDVLQLDKDDDFDEDLLLGGSDDGGESVIEDMIEEATQDAISFEPIADISLDTSQDFNDSCGHGEEFDSTYEDVNGSKTDISASSLNGPSDAAWTGGAHGSDSDSDDDDEERAHARFKSERQMISAKKSSPCDINSIPDKLEISNEQQQKINEFMSPPGGVGGGGGGRFRQNRHAVRGALQSLRGVDSGQTYRSQLTQRGHRPLRGITRGRGDALLRGPRLTRGGMMARSRGQLPWGQQRFDSGQNGVGGRIMNLPLRGRLPLQNDARYQQPLQQQMQHQRIQQHQQMPQRLPLQQQMRLQQQQQPQQMQQQMRPQILQPQRQQLQQRPMQQQPSHWQQQPLQQQPLQQQPLQQQLVLPLQQQQQQQQQQQSRPMQPNKVHINPHFRQAHPSLRLDAPVPTWNVSRQFSPRQAAMQSSFQSPQPRHNVTMNPVPQTFQERVGSVWSSGDSVQVAPRNQFVGSSRSMFSTAPMLQQQQQQQQFVQHPTVQPVHPPQQGHSFSTLRPPFQSPSAPYVSSVQTTHAVLPSGSAVEPVGQPIQTLVTRKQKPSLQPRMPLGGVTSRLGGSPKFQPRGPRSGPRKQGSILQQQSEQQQLARQRQNAQRQKLVARAKRFSTAAATVGPTKKVTTKRTTSSTSITAEQEEEEELSPSKQIRLQFETIAAKADSEAMVVNENEENEEQRESRRLMEQIEAQKKLRERVIKQKEQRRLAAAAARRRGNGDGVPDVITPAELATGNTGLSTTTPNPKTPASGAPGQGQSMAGKLVEVNDLSRSTCANKLRRLALQIGPVESVQVLQSQCKALIRFQSPQHAKMFAQQFDRHMIDLALVNVNVLSH